jgi:hypothetical protein
VTTLNFDFTQRGVFRRLAGPHAPRGHLDACFFAAVVGVPEHQQSAVAERRTLSIIQEPVLADVGDTALW